MEVLKVTWAKLTNKIICGSTNDNSTFIIYGGTEHYCMPSDYYNYKIFLILLMTIYGSFFIVLNITWHQISNKIICGTTNDNSTFITYGVTWCQRLLQLHIFGTTNDNIILW